MDFRILGPLEVLDGDRQLALGGTKQRALLALLLLRTGEVVSSDRLVAELWGETRLADARKVLQVAISRLRRTLEPDRAARQSSTVLATRAPGYVLQVAAADLDLHRFEALAAAGRSALHAGDPSRAAAALGAALAQWHGRALADVADEPFAQAAVVRLEELRWAALEDRIDADLQLGRHGQLIAELQDLVRDEPLWERPRAQLMLALYRSGRQATALEVYQDARRVLTGELGIDPGRVLQELQQAVLCHDPRLEPPVVTGPPLADEGSGARSSAGATRALRSPDDLPAADLPHHARPDERVRRPLA